MWQSFEIMIVRELSPLQPEVGAINEYRLDIVEGGTRLTKTSSRPTGPLLGWILLHLLGPMFILIVKRAFETFNQQIEIVYRAHHMAPEAETAFTGKQIREAAEEGLRDAAGDQ